MRADEPHVELRPRSALEAADLGFAMLRAWWRPVAATWLAIVLPIATLAALALRDSPWIAVLVLWWLRPLFARIPLHVLSRKVFGQPTGVIETVSALPSLARSGILLSLTLLRFSPARTLLQPVLQLEGLRGKARRERSSVLASRDVGAAMGVVSVAAHISGAIMFGVFFFVVLLVPEDVSWDLNALVSPFFEDVRMGWVGLFLPGIYFVAISVVEPVLVAAGFGMYLNRRVFLEGWDLEIALRRLAERARSARSPHSSIAALLACFAIALSVAGAAGGARAEDGPCQPDDAGSANACADALVATGDFGGTREVEWWVLKEFDFGEADVEDSEGLFGSIGPALAALIEVLAWAALGLAIVALAVAVARSLDPSRARPQAEAAAPTRLFGLDLEAASLPEDVVGAARAAWQAGDFIGAMSLLYRGALIHLIEAQRMRIPESATEYECIDLVRASQGSETSRAFESLTDAWVGTRYATSPPTPDVFDMLCAGFEGAFTGGEIVPEVDAGSTSPNDGGTR